MINGLLQDLRFATRQLARNPSFTAVSVLVLGLGISANVFTGVGHPILANRTRARIYPSLPGPDQDRMKIWSRTDAQGRLDAEAAPAPAPTWRTALGETPREGGRRVEQPLSGGRDPAERRCRGRMSADHRGDSRCHSRTSADKCVDSGCRRRMSADKCVDSGSRARCRSTIPVDSGCRPDVGRQFPSTAGVGPDVGRQFPSTAGVGPDVGRQIPSTAGVAPEVGRPFPSTGGVRAGIGG